MSNVIIRKVLVGQSSYDPLEIHVGVENIYYHDNLAKTIEYNKEKLNRNYTK